MNARIVEPEWLDTLPADNPGAIRSRADLRRVNRFMNNARLVARALRDTRPDHVLDLGAGDGAFAARVFELLGWQEVHCTLLDRAAIVPESVLARFESMRCSLTLLQRDAFDALRKGGEWNLIFTNLFLHHFETSEVEGLLRAAAVQCRWFVACEPRRNALALTASQLLGLIGCNAVTRHDAVASVRAGFRGDELTQLWPAPHEWSLQERPAGLFSHLFVARRL